MSAYIVRHAARLLAVLGILVLAACQQHEPIYAVPDDPAPALWLVTASGAEEGRPPGQAYLFGTIHLLPRDIAWFDARVRNAADRADRLILEVADLDDSAEASRTFSVLALTPEHPRPRILARLPAALRDDALQLADDGNVDLAMLDRMDSWAAALQLASATHGDLGLSVEYGVEARLTAYFRARGKSAAGLESVGRQLGIFDRLDETSQRAMLRDVVADADQAGEQFQALLSAWLAGDVAALDRLSHNGLLSVGPVRDALLVRRNADWSEQIAGRIARGERIFVAVGAAHLAGPDGVHSLLATRGFAVRRIE